MLNHGEHRNGWRGGNLVSIALLGLVAFGARQPALADWRFCNNTPEQAFVAIAVDNGDGYISMGWTGVPACGGCATALGGMPNNRGAFYSAHTDSLKWGGDNQFCVGLRDFTFKQENRVPGACEHRGGHKDDFSLTRLTGNNFTTNLNGRIAGKMCQKW